MLIPHTPIMALSATMSPNVLRYAQTALRMNKPTGLIKRSIDRPNIYLVCVPIEHPIASRKDLDYLIPLEMHEQEIRAIPKTVLFMDSRALVCATTTALITRLQPQFHRADIVCDYSTALSEARRKDVIEKFTMGECRIRVCTEAAGMGVDVPDISRVIQWTVSRQLNISNFWQRAGRCGRNRDLPGVAILFYNKTQQICNTADSTDEGLSLFCEPAYGSRSQLTLQRIRGFESADSALEEESANGGDSNERVENTQFEPGHINEETQVPNPHPLPPARFPIALKHIDKGLLWFLSTIGCRRAVVRQYFDDTSISPFLDLRSTVSQEEVPPAATSSSSPPCCDNCSNLHILGLNEGMTSLLPPSNPPSTEELVENTQASGIVENEEENNIASRGVPRNRAIGRDLRQTLKANLEKFRIDIWTQEGLNQRGGFFGPEFILQDKVITTLVQRARSIHDMESLRKALERDNMDIQFSVVGPHAYKLIAVIQSTLVEPAVQEDHANPNLLFPIAENAEPRSPTPLPSRSTITDRQMTRIRTGTRGRPPVALRAEEAQLEIAVARIADERMAEAVAKGEDGMRWNLSLLGKRSRGRPTAEMQEARREAEAARAEIIESLITEVSYPLLWARKSRNAQPI